MNRDLSVSLKTGKVKMNGGAVPDWTVDLVDTGMKTQTGGRIKRLAPYLGNETFMLTWGDGVSDINLNDLLAFHRSHGKLATLTAVRPTARFGHLEMDGNQITEFSEKPQTKEGWINGAFFVLEPEIFDFIDGDDTHFEKEPLERLAGEGQLMAYRHTGFWQCMDTIREKKILETYWETATHHGKLGRIRMRVLVTGHAGYIGTVLVPMLLQAGHEVVGLDTDLFERSTFSDGIAQIPEIRKDVRDVTLQDVEGFEAILHLAGLSNDPLGDLNPGSDLRDQPPGIGQAGQAGQAGRGAEVYLLLFLQQLRRRRRRPAGRALGLQPRYPLRHFQSHGGAGRGQAGG